MTYINIPMEVHEQKCPSCEVVFALIAIFHNDDPEYGKSITWMHQIYNKRNSFYCPYCGKNFREDLRDEPHGGQN